MATQQLFGRADTSLMQAAYGAFAANVPKDLSAMHARMAASYKVSVDSSAEFFKIIAKEVGKEGGKLIKAAREFNRTGRMIDNYNSKEKYKLKSKADFELYKEQHLSERQLSVANTYGDAIGSFPEVKDDDWTGMEKGDVGKAQGFLDDAGYDIGGAGIDEIAGPDTKKAYAEFLEDQKKIKSVRAEYGVDYDGEYNFSDTNKNIEKVRPMTVRGQLKEIRKEWWNIPISWNKEKRKARKDELRLKKDNIRKSVLEFQTFNDLVVQHLSADNINFAASTPAKLKFSQALLSGGKPLDDDSRAIIGFTEEGIMTFMYVDGYGRPITDKKGEQISVQVSNIKDLLTIKNPVVRGRADEVTNAANQVAVGEKGGVFDENAINSFVTEEVIDVAAARDLSFYQSPNSSTSLAGKLHNTNIFSSGESETRPNPMSAGVFGSLNPEIWDANDDDVIDADDFSYANAENYQALVDHVLSGEDLNLTKQFLKNHLVEEARVYHQQGLDRYKAAQNKPPRDPKDPKGKNRKVQYNANSGREAEIWSDDIVNIKNQLTTISKEKSGTKMVNVGEGTYAYIKGKGYIRAKRRDDGKIIFDRNPETKIPIGGYFPTINDVLNDQGIPLGYGGETSTKTTFVVGQVYELKGKKYEYLESGEWKEVTEAKDNPITDYEKRGDAWYYVKGDPGKGTYVSPKEYPALEKAWKLYNASKK